jgi:hypothetical protein
MPVPFKIHYRNNLIDKQILTWFHVRHLRLTVFSSYGHQCLWETSISEVNKWGMFWFDLVIILTFPFEINVWTTKNCKNGMFWEYMECFSFNNTWKKENWPELQKKHTKHCIIRHFFLEWLLYCYKKIDLFIVTSSSPLNISLVFELR